MNIKNLERAKEISEQLPALEQARSLLSKSETAIQIIDVECKNGDWPTRVTLPNSITYNVIAVLNVEINKLKEEIAKL
ncbi:MAG: hypothetical protein Q4F85_11825 [Prevotella sp.]|nr:hypothetical protein [Prevotella sp.]